MIWQSNSEKETFAVAEEIARQASPGDIYLLEGDLGLYLPKDLPVDWESRSRLQARPLPLFRSIMKAGFRYIILMCTGLRMWKKCMN